MISRLYSYYFYLRYFYLSAISLSFIIRYWHVNLYSSILYLVLKVFFLSFILNLHQISLYNMLLLCEAIEVLRNSLAKERVVRVDCKTRSIYQKCSEVIHESPSSFIEYKSEN